MCSYPKTETGFPTLYVVIPLFCVQSVKVKDSYSFCWSCWNYSQSLFILSFHNLLLKVALNTRNQTIIYSPFCNLRQINLLFVIHFYLWIKQPAGSNNDPMVKGAMSIARDEHWKFIRTTISPTFTSGKMRQASICMYWYQ